MTRKENTGSGRGGGGGGAGWRGRGGNHNQANSTLILPCILSVKSGVAPDENVPGCQKKVSDLQRKQTKCFHRSSSVCFFLQSELQILYKCYFDLVYFKNKVLSHVAGHYYCFYTMFILYVFLLSHLCAHDVSPHASRRVRVTYGFRLKADF